MLVVPGDGQSTFVIRIGGTDEDRETFAHVGQVTIGLAFHKVPYDRLVGALWEEEDGLADDE